MTRRTLQLMLLAAASAPCAWGQIDCSNSTASSRLVCLIPLATGIENSKFGKSNAQQQAFSQASAAGNAVDVVLAAQVSQLPLSSASGGTLVVFSGGVQEPFHNLGPILTDRAHTVGRHKLYLGFTGSQFVFTNIDGLSLGHLPFSYTLASTEFGNQVAQNLTSEVINAKLTINQFIAVATYGITDRFDISAIVPVEHVSMGAGTGTVNNILVSGTQVDPYTTSGLRYARTADGIGDVNFNVKGEMWRSQSERATISAAMDLRAPTGDDLNLLGSGSFGFNPYLLYSYLWRVSPHFRVGYQWNTKSELNDPSNRPGEKQSLPGGAQYDFGADWGARKSLTFVADLLGNQFLNTEKLQVGIVSVPTTAGSFPQATVQAINSSYSISNISTGLKWSPAENLVLSGNVLIPINLNNGLRARPTPLVGISYRFF